MLINKFLKSIVCLALICGSLFPNTANAQGVFVTLRGASDNLFSSTALNLLELAVFGATKGRVGLEGGYTYDIFNIKDNGEKVKIKDGNYCGFKAKDLFHLIEVGGKIGWQGPYSPIGVYGQCFYEVRNFRMKFAHDLNYEKYRSNLLKLGAGLRVMPVTTDDGSLFFEVGSTYNKAVGGVTPYGYDKSQFNNGVSTDFAIGFSSKDDNLMWLTSLGANINHYNFFNKEYSKDDGYYFPYANTKSTSWSIYLRCSIAFIAW